MITVLSSVSVFIGTSSEGMPLGTALQDELHARGVTGARRWDQDVFTPSDFTMQSLIEQAQRVDFAVLVATPDDVLASRDLVQPTARDNIIFEFGLFIGALGRERTFLLADSSAGMKLPSDFNGLNRLPYEQRQDRDHRLAVTRAASNVVSAIERRGRHIYKGPDQCTSLDDRHAVALRKELDLVCANARAQGWVVKTDSAFTLRLQPPRGRKSRPDAFSIGEPLTARRELRSYVATLRAYGLRVNRSVRRPVED